MEVFRQLDPTLAQQVQQLSPPLATWRKFVYCETLTGRLLGEVSAAVDSSIYIIEVASIVY